MICLLWTEHRWTSTRGRNIKRKVKNVMGSKCKERFLWANADAKPMRKGRKGYWETDSDTFSVVGRQIRSHSWDKNHRGSFTSWWTIYVALTWRKSRGGHGGPWSHFLWLVDLEIQSCMLAFWWQVQKHLLYDI